MRRQRSRQLAVELKDFKFSDLFFLATSLTPRRKNCATMGAPAYQVTNLETCSPRQVALLVLGFFGLWATLYGLGAAAVRR